MEKLITVKESDMEFMAKCFEHLKEELAKVKGENEILKKDLEPEEIGAFIDLDGFREMFSLTDEEMEEAEEKSFDVEDLENLGREEGEEI